MRAVAGNASPFLSAINSLNSTQRLPPKTGTRRILGVGTGHWPCRALVSSGFFCGNGQGLLVRGGLYQLEQLRSHNELTGERPGIGRNQQH